MLSAKTPALLLLLVLSGTLSGQVFNRINGLLCMKPEFVKSFPDVRSSIQCSAACSREQRCQAFSMAYGPCQLFVFDKCSKSVRNCSCSRRGQVFVKQQSGLETGKLCPTGYGNDLCGVKYKVLPNGVWSVQRQKCETESGLVIFADVTNSIEMAHIGLIFNTAAGGVSLWLGGFQPPGSAEPDGGWYWVACNSTVDGSLWGLMEPNDDGNEDATFARDSLGDTKQSNPNRAGLCECLSPFD